MSKDDYFTCLRCGCWDSECEACTMPSYDREYACPLYSKEEEQDDKTQS